MFTWNNLILCENLSISFEKVEKRIILHSLFKKASRSDREAFHSFLKKIVRLGEYQSGQLGQTVNLLSYDFIGSNPISPTICVDFTAGML